MDYRNAMRELEQMFDELPDDVAKKLVRLMERISEASYRRGFQQGKALEDTTLVVTPVDFRFKCSLDQSPYTDSYGGFSAIERLFAEFRELGNLGF